MTYAGEVVNGECVRCIVGTAAWAIENLGGEWYDSPDKIGIGWLWDGQQFNPPPTPDPDI